MGHMYGHDHMYMVEILESAFGHSQGRVSKYGWRKSLWIPVEAEHLLNSYTIATYHLNI
jgi:hypothetical protein